MVGGLEGAALDVFSIAKFQSILTNFSQKLKIITNNISVKTYLQKMQQFI